MIPAGAKCIKNKYRNKCRACGEWVEPESGAAILDANHVKWAAFHAPCLPQPYEEGDIPTSIAPPHPYHAKGPVTAAHVRCASCAHWFGDHANGVCLGSFRGAGRCTCTQYVVSAAATTVHSLNTGLISQSTAIAQMGVTHPVQLGSHHPTARLIVFSGPIHSATDGDTHSVSADSVLALHGIGVGDPSPDCTMLFFGPSNKRDYVPGPEDFVIGPRYTNEEYDTATKALAAWLVQKGIIIR